jgi:hypothetical protein
MLGIKPETERTEMKLTDMSHSSLPLPELKEEQRKEFSGNGDSRTVTVAG